MFRNEIRASFDLYYSKTCALLHDELYLQREKHVTIYRKNIFFTLVGTNFVEAYDENTFSENVHFK